MARPLGILTRRVTFGPAFTLGLGTPLSMAVKVRPSTSVVWAATGAPLIAILETADAESGMQGYMDLPLPGQDGFIDGNGNQVKDFTYRADVVYLDGTRIVGDGNKVFSLLPGEGDVDLDTMIPVTSNVGVTVAIPDSWTIAYERAVELAESFPASDTLPRYVEGELQTPDGEPLAVGVDDSSLTAIAADPESEFAMLQSATFVPRWAPLTAYALGAKVVSPSGVTVTAKAAFTSGAAYSAANWNLPSDFSTPAQVASTVALDKLRAVYRGDSTQLRRVRATLARAAAGQGFARLAFLGDSTVAGFGATPQTSWPVQLRDALAAVGYPAHGSGFVAMNSQTPDTRWTLNDWVAFAATESSAYKSVSASPAVFTSDKTGTTARVYYLQSNGPFSVSIDGGAPVTVTPTGASTIGEYSATGLANTTHSITLARTTTANCVILGVELLVSAAATGVRIANVGVNGSKAADIDRTAAGDWYKHVKFIRDQWNADCTFIMCETNDAFAGTPVATYKASMLATVQACQSGNRDVVLLTAFPASTVADFAPYTAALYEIALERNCVLMDIQMRMGDWTTANIYGQMTDAAHPNATGYRAAAQALASMLTS